MRVSELVSLVLQCLAAYNPDSGAVYHHAQRFLHALELNPPPASQGDQAGGAKKRRTGPQTGTSSRGRGPAQSPRSAGVAGGSENGAEDRRSLLLLSQDEKQFVSDMCCGVMDNKGVLGACADLLYAVNPELMPASRNLYLFLFYYAIYELPRQPFRKLRAILCSQAAPDALPFLRFVWGDARPRREYRLLSDLPEDVGGVPASNAFTQVVRPTVEDPALPPQLRHILDVHFSETYVTSVLTEVIVGRCYDEAVALIERISSRSEAHKIVRREVPALEVEPFQLTESKPPRFPEPELISTEFKARQMNRAAYAKSYAEVQDATRARVAEIKEPAARVDEATERWLEKREREREGRKERKRGDKAEKDGAQAGATASNPSNPSNPSSADSSRLPPIATSRSRPRAPKAALDVRAPGPAPRPTRATIYQADAVVQKRLAARAAELDAYAQGLHDDSDFQAWRAAMLERDRRKRLAEVDLRRRGAKLSGEDARAAQELARKLRRAQASELTAENMQLLLEHYEREERALQAQQEQNRRLEAENAQQLAKARQELEAQVAEAAERRREEKRENEEAISDRKLTEMAEKIDLIAKIHAELDVASAERREKLALRWDPSTPAGHRLLGEMSVEELRQRLVSLKQVRLQLEEERRQDILAEKRREAEELEQKQERIARVRQALQQEQTRVNAAVKSAGGSRDYSAAAAAGSLAPGVAGYAKLVEEVQDWAESVARDYEEDAARRQRRREREETEAMFRGEVARGEASSTKQRLDAVRARLKGRNTAEVFESGAADGTWARLAEDEARQRERLGSAYRDPYVCSRVGLDSAEAQKAQELSAQRDRQNREAYAKRQRDEFNARCAAQEAEAQEKKRLAAQEREEELRRAKGIIEREREAEKVQSRKAALRDLYTAKVGGRGYSAVHEALGEKGRVTAAATLAGTQKGASRLGAGKGGGASATGASTTAGAAGAVETAETVESAGSTAVDASSAPHPRGPAGSTLPGDAELVRGLGAGEGSSSDDELFI